MEDLNIIWENIDHLENYFITYLLYQEGKNVPQISKIRNMSLEEVNKDLIRAKEKLKKYKKEEKDRIHHILELDKENRMKFIYSLERLDLEDFKKNIYKRILQEKNAEDLMVLIWTSGELKDNRFLKVIHMNANHPHGGVRRMAYSAMGKIGSIESLDFLHRGLLDVKPQVRQYAAKSLGRIGNEVSLKKLKNLIQNPKEKEYVKRAFLEAIEIIRERILMGT